MSERMANPLRRRRSTTPQPCQCRARDKGAARYHKGREDGCPRKTDPTLFPGARRAPRLCTACLYGCVDG